MATAYHEAGHATVASALCLPVAGAFVANGHGGFASHSDTPLVPKLKPSLDEFQEAKFLHMLSSSESAKNDDDLAVDLATMLLAGVQAELLLAGEIWSGTYLKSGSDMERAGYLLQMVSDVVTTGYCQRRARSILTQHWQQVASIATTLLDRGFWLP